MAETGFPGTYSTTTTTTATTVTTNIRFDPSYIRTIPGILKIVALVSIPIHHCRPLVTVFFS